MPFVHDHINVQFRKIACGHKFRFFPILATRSVANLHPYRSPIFRRRRKCFWHVTWYYSYVDLFFRTPWFSTTGNKVDQGYHSRERPAKSEHLNRTTRRRCKGDASPTRTRYIFLISNRTLQKHVATLQRNKTEALRKLDANLRRHLYKTTRKREYSRSNIRTISSRLSHK